MKFSNKHETLKQIWVQSQRAYGLISITQPWCKLSHSNDYERQH